MDNIEIKSITENPIEIISKAAGTSYGKDDVSFKRIKHCFDNGHMGVFEHVTATFKIEGISRACSHQLVRHRIASFVQKSQRYTEVDNDDWYIVPDSIRNNPYFEAYKNLMEHAETLYFELLDHGVKKEDARYALTEATKTDIAMTMNLSSLFHFFDLRCDQSAQWEIRDLAEGIKDCLYSYNDEWRYLIDLYSSKENLREKIKQLEKENEDLKRRILNVLEDDIL